MKSTGNFQRYRDIIFQILYYYYSIFSIITRCEIKILVFSKILYSNVNFTTALITSVSLLFICNVIAVS